MIEVHGARERSERADSITRSTVFQVAAEDGLVLIRRRDQEHWAVMSPRVARELATYIGKGADEAAAQRDSTIGDAS